jgi:hypothetical protein
MYAVVRRYKVDPKNIEALNRAVYDRFVPLLETLGGLVSYYGVDVGNGDWLSFGVFRSKADADRSSSLAADFVRETIRPHVRSGPEILEGDIVASVPRKIASGVPAGAAQG